MLIEFSTANVLSFKALTTFSMLASNDDSLEESNIIDTGNLRLLKSAVVYGANAGGKSNLLKAMYFMRRMVLDSSKDTQANEEIDVESFRLNAECDGKPSRFEVVFLCSSGKHRYGFELDRHKIHSEWLFHVPRTREAELFVREGSSIKVNSTRFKEGRDLEEKTRDNALFLSVCAQFNGKIAKELLTWFRDFRFIHGLGNPGTLGFVVDKLKEPDQKRRILEMTKYADFGIDDLEGRKEKLTSESLPNDMPEDMKKDILARGMMEVSLKTIHRKFNKNNEDAGTVMFDLDENESAGTQKFLRMAGPLLDALDNGRILVIDELDARLHPLLTRAIVSIFNSSVNRANAQLIFASHDTGLLNKELFRRDQIWFAEKDQYGATDLYSLIELKDVRKEALFGKDYILGKYGAIPFIGDSTWLFCEGRNEE